MSINIVSRLESFTDDTPPFADVEREFRRSVLLEQRGSEVALAFTLHFAAAAGVYSGSRSKEVGLFRDHGIRPALLLLKQAQEGGLVPALREYARARVGAANSSPIERIELHLFPAP